MKLFTSLLALILAIGIAAFVLASSPNIKVGDNENEKELIQNPAEENLPYPHSGDVNGDGIITPDDAVYALLLYLDLYDEIYKEKALPVELADEYADLSPPSDLDWLRWRPYLPDLAEEFADFCPPGGNGIVDELDALGILRKYLDIKPFCSNFACQVVIAPENLELCLPETGAPVNGILTANDCNGPVIWQSSDESIAVVEPGIGATTTVTAVGLGDCLIVAYCPDNSGCTDVCAVIVTDCTPECIIEVFPEELTLCGPGTGATISGIVTATTCSGEIVWESSNLSVATVWPATGATVTVFARSLGTCLITAYCPDGDGCSDSCEITVADCTPPCQLDIFPPTLELCGPGTGTTISGVLEAATCSGEILWQSSDISIAVVNPATGASITVTAVGIGSCYIKAQCISSRTVVNIGSNCFDICPITVNDCSPDCDIDISPPSLDLCAPQTGCTVTGVLEAATCSGPIIWSSSDPSIALVYPCVGATTTVIAQGAGVCLVFALCSDGSGCVDSCPVSVRDCSSECIVDIQPPTLILCEPNTGVTTTGVLEATTCTGTIIWQSSDPNVASVWPIYGATTVVTSQGSGQCSIEAQCTDGAGCSDFCPVIVKDCTPVCKVNIYPPELDLCGPGTGATTTGILEAELCKNDVLWSSSDSSVATVWPATGATTVVTTQGIGQCLIKAYCVEGSGCYDICPITVEDCSPPCDIDILPAQLNLCRPGSGATVAGVLEAATCEGTVIWESTNPAVAFVYPATGATTTITAISVGQCLIQAICTDGNGCFDICPVTVEDCSPPCLIDISPPVLDLCGPGTGSTISAVLEATGCAEDILWQSTNPAVAVVNPTSGATTVVNAVGFGQCLIKAQCLTTPDCYDICAINVSDCNPDCEIDIQPPSLMLCEPGTGSTTVGIFRAASCTGTVIWESSDNSVAVVWPMVGSTTTVLAINSGNCLVTALCTDGYGCLDNASVMVNTCSPPREIDDYLIDIEPIPLNREESLQIE